MSQKYGGVHDCWNLGGDFKYVFLQRLFLVNRKLDKISRKTLNY